VAGVSSDAVETAGVAAATERERERVRQRAGDEAVAKEGKARRYREGASSVPRWSGGLAGALVAGD